MLNTPQIQAIIDEHNTGAIGFKTDVKAAAGAIADRLTLPHLMSEFVTPHSLRGYNVPDPGGRHNVWIEDRIICWDSKSARCYDSDKGGDPCPHVQAVELWKARQEAKK